MGFVERSEFLDAMAQRAVRQECDSLLKVMVASTSFVDAAVLRLLGPDGQHFHVAATAGDSSTEWESWRSIPMDNKSPYLAARAVGRRTVVTVAEAATQPHLFYNWNWIDKNEFRSIASSALLNQAWVFGTVTVYTRRAHDFTRDAATLGRVVQDGIVRAVQRTLSVKAQSEKLRLVEYETLAELTRDLLREEEISIRLHDQRNFLRTIREIVIRSLTNLEETHLRDQVLEQIGGLLDRRIQAIDSTRGSLNSLSYIHVPEFIESVVEDYREAIRHRAQIVPEIRTRLTIRMNRERLRLAVDNLIANAVQAIEQKGAIKGRIAVGASESRLDDDKYLDISVTDDGLGFGALDVEQIGREFPQGLAHGIGLYQVRRVAESSGGSFSSVPRPDGGTRATMSLNLSCIPHFRKRWLVKRSE